MTKTFCHKIGLDFLSNDVAIISKKAEIPPFRRCGLLKGPVAQWFAIDLLNLGPIRGLSSVGRAIALQAIGQGFESLSLHHHNPPFIFKTAFRLFVAMTKFVQPSAYQPIGFVRKIKGLKGMMVVHLDYPAIRWNPSLLFFYDHQTYVPYLVSQWTQDGTSAVLFLEEVSDRTAATEFQLKPVFLSMELFTKGLSTSSLPE